MKKFLALLMVFVLLLAACSNTGDESSSIEEPEEVEVTVEELYKTATEEYNNLLNGYNNDFKFTNVNDIDGGKLTTTGEYDSDKRELTVTIDGPELNVSFTINESDEIVNSKDMDLSVLSSLEFKFNDLIAPVNKANVIFDVIDGNVFEEDGDTLVASDVYAFGDEDTSYDINLAKDGTSFKLAITSTTGSTSTTVQFE